MEAACTNKVCLAFDDGQDPDEDVPHAQAAPLSSEHAAVCAVSLAAANAQASGAEHIPTRGRRCHRNQRLWRQAELAGAALFLLLAGGGAGFLASSLLHSSELSVSSGPDRGSTAVTPPVNGASIARTDASPSQKEYVCEYIYRFDGDCDEDPVETYLDVMALEQCERLCCSDDGCVSFAYTATRFTCWLYRHCGIYVTNQNTTTGMKKTSRPTAAEEAGAPWPLLGVPSAPTPWSPPPSASQFPTLAPTQATTSVPTPAPSAALIPAPTSAIMPGQTPIPTMSFGSRIQPMRDTRKCVSAVQLGSSSAGLWILDCSEENLSQLWKMDMYGHIRLASNLSLCIHGHGDYFSKGPSAQLSECSSLKSGQQWLMTNGGHMRLQPSMELCLEVDGSADGGNAVEMRKCAIEATNQLFIADFPATALYAATPPPPLPPTRILATTPAPTQAVGSLIRLKHQPDKCLGYTDGSSDEGADLRLWDCNNSDPLQLWRMDVSGLIRLAHSQEMCLHVNTIDRDSSGESDEDVPVWSSSSIAELHTCNLASPDQQWVVSPAGHIRLRSDISWCIESPKDTSIGDKSTSLRKCKHADDRQLFDLAFPATAPDVDPPTPAPATTAPTPAQTTPGESSEPDGYNLYLGSTCNDTFLDPSTVASARECREVCDADPRCNAYSYHVQRRRCYTREACDNRVENDAYVTAIKEYYDRSSGGVGELECAGPAPCTPGPGEECPQPTQTREEMPDPRPGTSPPPYQDILDGNKTFIVTHPDNRGWDTCPFRPPTEARPVDWADQCIANARGVGFLEQQEKRPNEECPAGWFLCKGMCYTLVQRNNRGPATRPEYYSTDFMGVEQRCGLCGGARVAFVGEDPEMQRVAAEAARQTINEDRAVFVRRFRFLDEPNPLVENFGDPYQPWHRFVVLQEHDERKATYQRYYTGEKDRLSTPQWDVRYRNQEASILCVNTLDRIRAAVRTVEARLTMEEGCFGSDRNNIWGNKHHRWFPEHNWPFPGH